ncbi:head-tail joining protein [Microbulbifer sp. PSTR4-B]|uniref:head-tail joining protein n=1 Tax=unclassified Microbulbifer TaxID=2619833 RepID=UPI00403AB347
MFDELMPQLNDTIDETFNELAPALYHRMAGGAPLTVSGDFEAPSQRSSGPVGSHTGTQPSWKMRASQAPQDWQDGDLLEFKGTTYRVRAPLPDGAGFVIYELWDYSP